MMGFEVSVLAALAAGALSFLSPCVLPLVPAYLVFLGAEDGRRHRALPAALAFVLGFSSLFVVLGASATSLSRLVGDYRDGLVPAAGMVVMAFGLHVMGVTPLRWLYAERRFHTATRPAGLAGAFVLGLAFGFGWTPCVGPVLASILMLAAGRQSMAEGIGLLAAYAAGMGGPFLAAAILADRFGPVMARLRPHLGRIERATGMLLVATGALMALGRLSLVAEWILDVAPGLGRLG